MKKLFGVLALAGIVALVACGPSAEELEKALKRTADSLDSIAKVDSTKIADSIAAIEAAAADTNAVAEGKTEEVK